MKWVAQEATRALHLFTSHTGPLWCEGRWIQFIFDDAHWQNTIEYIERHNVRRGVGPRPYIFFDDDYYRQ